MQRIVRLLGALVLVLVQTDVLDAQRGRAPRHPVHPPTAAAVHGTVFIGGYFYDPVWGPYPWWPRTAYPYWYWPTYDRYASIRLRVEPDEAEDAAVYVDGFYAGVVDDFNSVFQALPLTPGGHRLVLYLEGWRTVRHNVYLGPASNLAVAKDVAKAVRGSSGGLRYVKGLGLEVDGQAQVSMNLVDIEKTPLYRAFDVVKMEAEARGVSPT